VNNAFSSKFDNYKIIVSDGVASASADLRVNLGSSTSGYFSGLIFNRPNSSGVVGLSMDNGSFWQYAGSLIHPNGFSSSFELFGPFLNRRTSISADAISFSGSGGAIGSFKGFHNIDSSYTSFSLTPSAGTISSGTIFVYGYRKA
jgi:hypothetical protein